MHKLHYGLTVAAPLKEGKWGELRAVLKALDKCPDVFNKSESILFVSGAIIPKQENQDGESLPESLIFTTAYWGPFKVHLNELVQNCRSCLCDVFKHCVDFPEDPSDNQLIAYLTKHSCRGAYNSRYNCITKTEVQLEKDLRQEIEKYVDKVQKLIPLNERSSLQVKQLIERHLTVQGEKFEWARKPVRLSGIEMIATNRGRIIIWFLLVSLSMAVGFGVYLRAWIQLGIGVLTIVILILAGILLIRHITKCPNETACRPHDRRTRRMASTQLRPILNEMIAAAPLKKGKTRRFFYYGSLRVVNFLSGLFMNVPTVSNIRWVATDNKKRLLFTSIYSNTTDFYVREFLTGSTSNGVNFMFTHGMGFPDAKWLFKEGIKKDPEGYMHAVHSGQHLTDLWYAHEKDLTAEIISQNRKLRNGLFQPMNEYEARAWLRLI